MMRLQTKTLATDSGEKEDGPAQPAGIWANQALFLGYLEMSPTKVETSVRCSIGSCVKYFIL